MRFFREAAAYDTCRFAGIPQLIESNAHNHQQSEITPFIATAFIEGPTLRKWRQERSDVSLDDVSLDLAVAITRALLEIIRECHAIGLVHRDIKPDNIILESESRAQPILLDFGLSFRPTPQVAHQTEQEQEIGNRFLRLPELSSGSPLKQDLRSDLSFAAGILFFLLTGKNPNVLLDAERRMPHQRSEELAILQNVAGTRFPRLASLFDDAFVLNIDDRYTSADALLTSLDRMMQSPEEAHTDEDDLRVILETVDTGALRRDRETRQQLSEALRQVRKVHSEVQRELRNSLGLAWGGTHLTGETGKVTFAWNRTDSDDRLGATIWEVRATGDELTFRMAGETVFRTSGTAPRFDEQFRETIRAALLNRLREALTDPNALPPESEYFLEFAPLPRLADAAEKARQEERNIFAFVYDPSQPSRGRLDHALRYFLQNRKTREALHATFVVALVPLSDVSARSDILNNQSMETARWIILDSYLNPLKQAVIYANPQVAEELVLDLAKKYGPA